MTLFIEKVNDIRFNVYNAKHQRLYTGATTTKILSIQAEGDTVVASCEGGHHWLFGPNNPERPEQAWRTLKRF